MKLKQDNLLLNAMIEHYKAEFAAEPEMLALFENVEPSTLVINSIAINEDGLTASISSPEFIAPEVKYKKADLGKSLTAWELVNVETPLVEAIDFYGVETEGAYVTQYDGASEPSAWVIMAGNDDEIPTEEFDALIIATVKTHCKYDLEGTPVITEGVKTDSVILDFSGVDEMSSLGGKVTVMFIEPRT